LPTLPPPLWAGERWTNKKIRIAYLSADFNAHATAYLIARLFELHDRDRFEVLGISYGHDDKSEIRSRLSQSFDEFHDVRAISDAQVARMLNDRHVDIVLDLKGYTTDARYKILAHRPAPIQVNYLGYPGSMGVEFIDYVIADKTLVQHEEGPQYNTESIVYLPDTFQVNDSTQIVPPCNWTRSALGLPEDGFVFCCFNNTYKLTAEIFHVWMRLLRSVERSVLWLLQGHPLASDNLRREAQARGVDPARLVFAPRTSHEDHLARHRSADLFLDTLPVNALTTASDALWAGLPMITCLGTAAPGRGGASILRALGLEELITTNLTDYEALAYKLATDPIGLHAIKAKLEHHRDTFPLFNTDRYRVHLESAYKTMWETWQRGLPPGSFHVEPR
jgi:predicted O-linked N-acetylglucosamine transferase (SPINDLY family)